MTLVTIGLPVYNAAPFMAHAIQSVLNQTLTGWELLIVDDGSTDDSLAIAQSFTDPRIRVLADGVNRGVAARLNQIARLATGHYLARLDADDVMMPGRLRAQVDYMTARLSIDGVGAFAYIIDTDNQVYGIRGITDLPTTPRQAAAGVSLIHPTLLARTDWFRRNPYREDCRRAEDFELWLRTIGTTSFRVISEPLLCYRERGLPLLKKYSETAADVRTVLRQYRNLIGPWRIWQLILRTYTKEAVYRLTDSIGQTDWLIRRRSSSLSAGERQRAQAVLDRAIKTANLLQRIDS